MKPLRALAALALLAAAAPAGGYERSTSQTTGVPLFWPTSVVPYHESVPHPHTCPPDSAGDPALAAVRASFEAWRPACSALALTDAGPLAEIRTGSGGTGENVVVFRQGWCRARLPSTEPCLNDPDLDCGGIYNCFEDHADADRFTLALTSVLYYPDTGRIVDADIEMNGWDGQERDAVIVVNDSPPAHGWYFTCEEPQDPPSTCAVYGETGCVYADVQNTLTHEVGHFIGLRHVCDGGGASDADLPDCRTNPVYAEATMYPVTRPGELGMRTLDDDDVAGVCAIYPAAGVDSGGCGCGAGGAPGALAALLAGAAALFPRRRRRRG